MPSARNRNIRYNHPDESIWEDQKGIMDTEHTTPTGNEWKVRRVGTVTFAISKPKRKPNKLRQMRLKNRRRAR